MGLTIRQKQTTTDRKVLSDGSTQEVRTTTTKTVPLSVPREWAMYTKGGNTKVRNVAQRALTQMERAVEAKDKTRAKKVLIRLIANWYALSYKKGTEEASDTEVRECVAHFHDKLAEASGFWDWVSYDLWDTHRDLAWAEFKKKQKKVAG